MCSAQMLIEMFKKTFAVDKNSEKMKRIDETKRWVRKMKDVFTAIELLKD